jgi:hypothetical protein
MSDNVRLVLKANCCHVWAGSTTTGGMNMFKKLKEKFNVSAGLRRARLTYLVWAVLVLPVTLLGGCSPRDGEQSTLPLPISADEKMNETTANLPDFPVDSLSISPDGSRALFIAKLKTGNKLFSIDLNVSDPLPKQLAVDGNPVEVVAGEGQSFAVVTRRSPPNKQTRREHYTLAKYSSDASSPPQTIIESDIFIGSLAYMSDSTYVFQLGVDVTSGRSVSQFFTKGLESPLNRLSAKRYGYKVGVSVTRNNLIFLSGEQDQKGNYVPDIIPLAQSADVSSLLNMHISQQLESLACSRSGELCFSTYRYTAKGEVSFSHQLVFTNGVATCKPDIPYKWIEFPEMSQSGNAIAFLTTNDGKAAPVNRGRRKVIVLRTDMSTCNFQIQQINL